MRAWLGVLGLVLVACSAEDTDCLYEPPVADAGSDYNCSIGQTCYLDASASAASCGRTLEYTWTLEEAPEDSSMDNAIFGDANGTDYAVEVNYLPDCAGLYAFSLVVFDGLTSSESDDIEVGVVSH